MLKFIMDEYDSEGESPENEKSEVNEDPDGSSEEEGFIQGYNEDEEVKVCEECGTALREGKKSFHKEINGEGHVFCSKACAEEYEETLKTE